MGNTKRKPSGTPKGGEWAEGAKAEADAEVSAGLEGWSETDQNIADCSECGAATKRRSGMCRRCDPARSSGSSKHKTAKRSKKDGLKVDRQAGSLTPDEVTACGYQFVPDHRGGQPADGQTRQCRNAVRAPAAECHRHGGPQSASLGRSVAKATAEAERGECFPLSDQHWQQAQARVELAQSQLETMLKTAPTRLVGLYATYAAHTRKTSTARFSTSNQFLVLSQHYGDARHSGADPDTAIGEAVAKCAQTHMTAREWAKHGRRPKPDAQGVAVVWMKPRGQPEPERDDDESDEDYAQRLSDHQRRVSRRKGQMGGIVQYPLDQTEGDPFDEPEDPLAVAAPGGDGDPVAARKVMQRTAADMGVAVSYVTIKPTHGYAYWSASDNQIVVWSGVGGGDESAMAHALAHELGHARLGHSTRDSSERHRGEKEVAAESFAAMVCAHHNLDSAELSAWYVAGWAQDVDAASGGQAAVRSAAEAFDEYVGWASGSAADNPHAA